MEDKRVFWVWLSLIVGAGTKTADILAEYQSPNDILNDIDGFFARNDLLTPAMRRRRAKISTSDAEKVVNEASAKGIKILGYDHENFPARLRNFDDCPLVLYCIGDTSLLSGGVNVGVIGTRKATVFGREQTAKLVSGIVSSGITPVSGFAVGIDEEANITWTSMGARGVVVVGCGLDINYPARLWELREKIEKLGVVISEYPLGTQPLPGNFPVRNRIIAGLCEGVLVPQAPAKSGALITAHQAIDYGKDLFVVPTAPGNFSTMGNISLLKDGCIIVTEAEDIISRYTDKLYNTNKPKKSKITS